MMTFKISLICFIFVVLGEPGHIFAPYQRLINRLPMWLNKPLGTCAYCLTGEVAFWYYILVEGVDYKQVDGWINFLAFVSFSIFLIKIYQTLWNYEP